MGILQISELVQEPKFSHITRNLFLTLAANGRIGESSKVIRDFSGEFSTPTQTLTAGWPE